MNLDTKLVVAILGQDFALCCDTFGFPTLLFFDPPWLNREVRLFAVRDYLTYFTMLSPCTNMKRTASQALEDPVPPILKPVLELTLHIALSPIQFQALLDQRPIVPDPYSSRGLRTDPLKALERAHYFMNWSAPYASPSPQTEIKKFMLCKINFSPVGVLTLQQEGLLEPGDGRDADRKGYFRYKGPLFHQLIGEHHGAQMEYCRFASEYQELVWVLPSLVAFSGIAGG